MTTTHRTVPALCSFCGKADEDVASLVAGPGVFICDECVELASQLIAGKPAPGPAIAPWDAETSLDAALASLGPAAAGSARVENNLAAWVSRSRALGATWTQVGDALGVTRQSAWGRFSGEE